MAAPKTIARALAAVVVFVVSWASPALAHVSIYPDPTPAGSTTTVEFRVPHGCDGASTNRVVVDIPDGFGIDTVLGPDGWAGGSRLGPDGEQVVWGTTAAVLPDNGIGVFQAVLTIPTEPGRYTLPVRQQCVNGTEILWDGVNETAAVLNVGPADTPAGELPALDDTPLHLDDHGDTDDTVHDHGDMDMGGGHDHGDLGHSHDEPVTATAPMSLRIDVTPDPKAGYNLTITTDGFRWSPEGASGPHVDGDGHAHLYVNGAKTRIYGPHHHLALDPGVNTIEVSLNANDHRVYFWNGEPVASSVAIDVPGGPDDNDMGATPSTVHGPGDIGTVHDDGESNLVDLVAEEESSLAPIVGVAAAAAVAIGAAVVWAVVKTRTPATSSPAAPSAEPHE